MVNVSDDGPGGARPEGGSGLRGLADRVAAAGGVLGGQPARMRDPAGGGPPVPVTPGPVTPGPGPAVPAQAPLRVVIAEDAVLLREGPRWRSAAGGRARP